MTSILPREVARLYRDDRPFTGEPMSIMVKSVDDFSTDPDRWYCRYCRHLNHPDALYCGEIVDGRGAAHCGAPRPEEAYELPEELAEIEDIPRDIGVKVGFDAWDHSLFLTDDFWRAVQGVAFSGGLDVEEAAQQLRSAIVTKSLIKFSNLGIHFKRGTNLSSMGTNDLFSLACNDSALNLDTYSCMSWHPLIAAVRKEWTHRYKRAVFGSPTGRILDNLGMTLEL